jgi:hypothetical protein
LFDVAVVLSKDTDLVEPMRVVKEELRKIVGLICPDDDAAKPHREVASFVRHITRNRLATSQFPDPIIIAGGSPIHKPSRWR